MRLGVSEFLSWPTRRSPSTSHISASTPVHPVPNVSESGFLIANDHCGNCMGLV